MCPRIDSLRFLTGCHRRRLNQSLVVEFLIFLSVLNRACFCVFFAFWAHALFSSLPFIISINASDGLGRFISEVTCYVLNGTLKTPNVA